MVQLGLCQEYENSLKGEYLLIFIKWKNNISIDKSKSNTQSLPVLKSQVSADGKCKSHLY